MPKPSGKRQRPKLEYDETASPFDRFESLAKRLVAVPKSEIDEAKAKAKDKASKAV